MWDQHVASEPGVADPCSRNMSLPFLRVNWFNNRGRKTSLSIRRGVLGENWKFTVLEKMEERLWICCKSPRSATLLEHVHMSAHCTQRTHICEGVTNALLWLDDNIACTHCSSTTICHKSGGLFWTNLKYKCIHF